MTQTVGVVGGIKPVVSRDRAQSPITTYNYIGRENYFFSRYVISLHYFYFFSLIYVEKWW